MYNPDTFNELIKEVRQERARQHELWDAAAPDCTVYTYLSVLSEEVGEANRAVLDREFGDAWKKEPDKFREEMIQVAAVAMQILERLERGELL